MLLVPDITRCHILWRHGPPWTTATLHLSPTSGSWLIPNHLAAQHRRGHRAPALAWPGEPVATRAWRLEDNDTRDRTQHPATATMGLYRLSLSFSFLWKACGDPLALLPGRVASPGQTPKQGASGGLGVGTRRNRLSWSFWILSRKDHGAQRSGPSLWKRSFCVSRQDRNKTLSCRLPPRLAALGFWRPWPSFPPPGVLCASGGLGAGAAAPRTPGPEPAAARTGFWRPAHGKAGNALRQRSCADSFCVLPLWGKGCRDPLLLLPGPSFCVLAERRGSNPARPRVVALRAALRASAALAGRSRAARRAAASGLRRWPICDNSV